MAGTEFATEVAERAAQLMTIDQHDLYVSGNVRGATVQGTLRGLLRRLAPQDFLVFFYLLGLNLAVLNGPPNAARTQTLASVFALALCHAATLVAIRSGWLTHPVIAPLAYRLTTYGSVQVTYFMFADLLPLANPAVLDQKLYDLDLRLFGVEPAVYLDRFVGPLTTEWFSFFYFGYFFLLALHVLPILFLVKEGRMLGEFTLGMLVLFCVGHTLYILVPGYGPYKAMPELFTRELTAGPWWNITQNVVAQSGAQKDIFPSLHTAAPTLILLFSFHRRGELPFRYTWPIVGFFAVNIVIATMFLRWHYVIDVVAGLLLGLFAHAVSVRLTDRELLRRKALGLGPIWPEWAMPASIKRLAGYPEQNPS